MKASTLIFAVALTTAAAGAFAQSDTTPGTSNDPAASRTQTGSFVEQGKARDRQLEQQGEYSQYAD